MTSQRRYRHSDYEQGEYIDQLHGEGRLKDGIRTFRLI